MVGWSLPGPQPPPLTGPYSVQGTVPGNQAPSRPSSRSRVWHVGHKACFHGRVKKRNTFLLTMRFMDPEMETRYSVEKEKQSGAAFSCSCVVLFCTAMVEILIDPW